MDISILIIEDNLLAAEDLRMQLEETGYQIAGIAVNKAEVLEVLSISAPDLLIVDIELENGESGIEIVKELNQEKTYPVVFLTGVTNQSTVKSALNTNPATYLVKPYNLDELVINIDLAMRRQRDRDVEKKEQPHQILKGAIFIPDRQTHVRVNNEDIYVVEADGSYIRIYTKEQTYHLSSNLKNFMSQFEDPDFIRVSRKHLVNTRYIKKINGNTLYVGPMDIQISKEQRQGILKQFNILKTKKG